MLISDKQGPGFVGNPVGQLEVIGNQIDALGNAIPVFIALAASFLIAIRDQAS